MHDKQKVTIDFTPIFPYVERLVSQYPSIESLWLVGSRANDEYTTESDWDLLVFADNEVFERISTESKFDDPRIDLLVIYDGDRFANPFGGKNGRREKKGSLSRWEWEQFTLNTATYEGSKTGDGKHINIEQKTAVKIWPNDEVAFAEYSAKYPMAMHKIAESLASTSLRDLESSTLRMMYSFESRQLRHSDPLSQAFFHTVLSKVINECFGFIGCMKNGAFLAAHHHTRAIWEMYATVNYALVDNDKKRQKRLTKFNEFPNLQRYLHYKKLSKKLENGELTPEDFAKSCIVNESEFKALAEGTVKWCRTWGCDEESLDSVAYWHSNASIKDIFATVENSETIWQTYELLCHATHLSPMGVHITAGLQMIGFPCLPGGEINSAKVEGLISLTITALRRVLLFLHAKTDNPIIWEMFYWDLESDSE